MITDRYSNIIERYDYTLGTAGERLSVQETNRTIHYTYDDLYRLTRETIQDGALDLTIDYTYDAVGNRLTQTDLLGTTVYTYNALNQLILENDTVYTYDDNGALISVSGPDRSAEYTYNDLGRMSTATVTANGTTITESYLYDWAGTRTAKITDGVLTYYLVDTGGVLSQVLAELDHTGALITYYTRGSEIISISRPGEKHYYLNDGHGSVRALSDTDGQVTDTYLYDAFGNLLTKTGTTANDFLYTGEQYDANTGFYYLRARYMNPSTGTFTSMDANAGTIFDPVSLHKYLYANANPVMNRDPSGYQTLTLTETGTKLAIIGILAAAVILPVCIINLVSRQGVGYTPINVSSITDGMIDDGVWGDISIDIIFAIRDAILDNIGDWDIEWSKRGKTKNKGKEAEGEQTAEAPAKSGGTQTSSRSWKGPEGRIDVENHDPGNPNRPGQIHFQPWKGGGKWLLDIATMTFIHPETRELAPKAIQKILELPWVQKAISKALEYLGM